MSIIQADGHFTCLPRDYYFSPQIFELELDRVFSRQWQYVGHVSEVRNPGDYFTRMVGPESMIITRDRAGEVRAYFNVCRHRGYRICEDGAHGNTKHIVCPYHRWTYSTEGELLGAPGSPDGADFDYAQFPLHEARCDVYFGSIFVYLGDDEHVPPVREIMPENVDEDQLRMVQPERLKVAHRESYLINANWKVALENNCECYHCAGSHPALGVACDYTGFYTERDGGPRYEDKLDSIMPLRPGMETFSRDGKFVSKKPLGDGTLPPQFSTGYLLVPNFSAVIYMPDHVTVHDIKPVTVDTCEMVCSWLVHEDAIEGTDYDVERVIDVMHVTNLEDGALAERNYLGMKSRRFVPGPNSPTRESFLREALGSYLDMMGEDALLSSYS